ncbi:DUF6163 family protein [Methylocapsa acidiphila]|uniref:DUF6163 family protein n=1 Tax=Methylocapsa acidiphila TaxID=133552 RepID=UPI0003FF1B95|nr:DUF6163 family protein [Methylocapsa acidiphila]
MKAPWGSEKKLEPSDSGAAIRLGDSTTKGTGETSRRFSWGRVLVVFMRLLAVIWVAQGLLQWSAMLLPEKALFDTAAPIWSAAAIFFAILDLVAAVGLWLATPWGGVLWLFGAIAQILATLAIPNFFSMIWISVNIILIVAYFTLTWAAGRANPPFIGGRQRRS